jgi:hypothetical protein
MFKGFKASSHADTQTVLWTHNVLKQKGEIGSPFPVSSKGVCQARK